MRKVNKTKMRFISVEVPITPISINQAWQGRRFRTAYYKKYQRDFYLLLPKQEKIEGDVAVSLVFYLKHPLKSDLDNYVKPVLDILQQRGYISNDRYIWDLRIRKRQSNKEKVKIEIFQL